MNRNQMKKYRLTAALLAALMLLTASVPAVAETFSAIVTSSSMTVYKDAALSTKAGALPKNAVVRIASYSGKAARITWSGKSGYAKVSDMTAVDDVAAKAVNKSAAKVYQEPSTDSRSVKLKANTKLYVLKTSGNWAMVERNGAVGYMKASALTRIDDDWQTDAQPAPTDTTPAQAVKGTVTAARLPVYKTQSTSGSKLGTLKKGQVVDVLRWNTRWAYISLNGKYGYCAVTGLTKGEVLQVTPTPTPVAVTGTEGTVTAAKLPVYTKASTSSTKLGTLKKGQVVTVLRWNGNWAYVELKGKYGFCAVKGLSRDGVQPDVTPSPTATVAPTATPSLDGAALGTVTADTLKIYKTASTAADKVGSLVKGETVNVLKWNDSRAFVEHNGIYGFCAVTGLRKAGSDVTPAPTATPSTDKAVKATVTADSVTVYQLAGDQAAKVGSLKKGQEVNVLSVAGDWAYIELSGNYGFCELSALTRTSDLEKYKVPSDYRMGGFTATVVYPNAQVFASPSAAAASTGIALGKSVNVYAYSEEWACVVNDSSYGFIPIKHLSKAEYSVINGDCDELQTLLKALLSYGYYDGIPTTAYSAAATAAISRFQSACGMSETGVADEALQRILYAGYAPTSSLLSSTLAVGNEGNGVTRLQMRLYALGYLSKTSSLDGSYGTATNNAVALFQKASGLSVTGTADPATLKALYSTGAAKLPSGSKAADESSGGSVVTPSGTVKLSSTYVTTMPAELKSTTSSYSSGMSSGQKLEHVIYAAQEKLGKPYVYGATGPNSFDCSGLTQYSFKKVSVSLKRSAYSQGYDSSYDKISGTGSLKRGDLVFFNTISDSDLSDHVGIYLGGGCFIHASSGGHKVVVSNITSGYYNRVFSWGRRILN